jgi:medium-chain acyl-[acyl-carrier-protein] hydrolase
MSEIKTIWEEEVPVRSFETDFMERWKPSCIFQAMQETATHHASHFGFPYKFMLDKDLIWIISRVKVKFFTLPVLGDRVIIRTWPKGIQQKVFFMRDFQLLSPDGRQFVVATTAWILVSPKARRFLLPQALPGKVPDNDGLSAMDELLEKIPLPDGMPERLQVQAGYSSVDLMGHVNNARYVEWISDCFGPEEHAARKLDWMQVNYINEVKQGESVSITAAPSTGNPDLWAIQGANLVSGARAFEALVNWERR